MEDIIGELNKLIDNASTSKKFLARVDKVLAKAKKSLEVAYRRIEMLRSPEYPQAMADEIILSVIDNAPDIYTKQVSMAIGKNAEFAYPEFSTPLLDIADDPDLFTFLFRGSGWNIRAIINLSMDAVAGTISDYASAVSDARDYLDVGKGDPVLASEKWKKIYKSNIGIYAKTINTRSQFFNSPAPFWSILNYGNKVNMNSDRGGSPYPNSRGTFFVEGTKTELEEDFNSRFIPLKAQTDSEIKNILSNIESVKSLTDELNSIIDRLDSDFESAVVSIKSADSVITEIGSESTKLEKKSTSKIDIGKAVKSISKVIGSAISRLFGLE